MEKQLNLVKTATDTFQRLFANLSETGRFVRRGWIDMKRWKIWLRSFVVLGLVMGLGPWTPPASAGEILSLKACVKRAIAHNYTIRSYASERRAVAMEVKQALAPFYPSLSFGTSFERSDWEDVPRNDQSEIDFRANYNLFRGGGDWSALKSKKHSYQASSYDLLEESLSVVASVQDTFFAILSLDNRLQVLKKSVDAAQLHEKYAAKRVKAQLAPLSDRLRASVDLSNARVDLIRARRNLKTLKHTLAVLMGQSPFQGFQLVKCKIQLKAGKMPLKELFALARKNRPILKSYQQQIHALAWQEKSLKAEFLPTIDTYVTSGEEGYYTFPDKTYWTLGIELKYPFFTGFSTHYAVENLRAKLESKRWIYSQMILKVQKEIADAYDQFKTDVRVIEASQTLLKSALENLKVAQRRYEVGVGTIVELTDARVEATKAAIGLENAKLTVLGDEIELRRTTGWFVPVIERMLKDGKDASKKSS